MPTAMKSQKTNRVVARVSSADKALLERAASLEGRSVAAFVVSHVRTAAERVLQAHETVRLTAAQSRRFVEALLAPPRPPTKRLKSALALHRELVTEH